MKTYIIPHIVRRPIEKLLSEYEEDEYTVVYADDKMYYKYWEDGWKEELKERVVENLADVKGDVVFITVGFQPAVILIWEIVRGMFGDVEIMTYDSEMEKFVVVG